MIRIHKTNYNQLINLLHACNISSKNETKNITFNVTGCFTCSKSEGDCASISDDCASIIIQYMMFMPIYEPYII